MNPHDHNVVIRKGSNAWLVQRTDRDEASSSSVIESCAHFLNRSLNQASPAGFRGVFQQIHVSSSSGRFVIGAARPILVTAHDARPTRPDGLRTLATSADGQVPRRVRAVKPWYLQIVFEWHGGEVRLPWPQHAAHVLGSELVSDLELDWLLLESLEAVPA
jgi:hypothetical protein